MAQRNEVGRALGGGDRRDARDPQHVALFRVAGADERQRSRAASTMRPPARAMRRVTSLPPTSTMCACPPRVEVGKMGAADRLARASAPPEPARRARSSRRRLSCGPDACHVRGSVELDRAAGILAPSDAHPDRAAADRSPQSSRPPHRGNASPLLAVRSRRAARPNAPATAAPSSQAAARAASGRRPGRDAAGRPESSAPSDTVAARPRHQRSAGAHAARPRRLVAGRRSRPRRSARSARPSSARSARRAATCRTPRSTTT